MNKLVKFLIEYKWLIMAPILMILLLTVCDSLFTSCSDKMVKTARRVLNVIDPPIGLDKDTVIIIPDITAPIVIQRIEEKGDVYTLNAELEDMTTRKRVRKRKVLGYIVDSTEYKCVQVLTQKCSYKFALNEVEYCVVPDEKTIYVRMPELKYVASTIDSQFICDDKDFWHDWNPNKMITETQEKIKDTFCTDYNKNLAKSKAEDIVENILSELGFEVYFVDDDLKKHERPEIRGEKEITIKKSDFYNGNY